MSMDGGLSKGRFESGWGGKVQSDVGWQFWGPWKLLDETHPH